MELLLVIRSTSCYRDYLLLSETPLVIGNTSCYRKHLLLSVTPLVIETTSCYHKHLLLSETPLVLGNTSCSRKHLLLSRLPLVVGNTSCYRKDTFQTETILFQWMKIETTQLLFVQSMLNRSSDLSGCTRLAKFWLFINSKLEPKINKNYRNL